MIHQPDQNRYCINMVYASPIRRGCAEIIEDIVPIYNINLKINMDADITRVYEPLTSMDLPYLSDDKHISFTVPELNCHNTIVIEYKK